MNAHLRASDMLDDDSNESSRMTIKLTKKGFRILEVRLASCLLIGMCIPPTRYYTIFILIASLTTHLSRPIL